MAQMFGLRPLLVAAAGACALAACSSVQNSMTMMRNQLVAPAVSPPVYQPGLEYLSVSTPTGPAWMVRAYADERPAASGMAPTLVWYARPDLMLRTESGRVTSARGFARTLLRLDASQCPHLLAYPKLTQPVTCAMSLDSDSVFGLRQTVRIDPPRVLLNGWDDLPGPLLLVREKALEGPLPGNFYLFSPRGELLRSRQWIAHDFWLELKAPETASGMQPEVAQQVSAPPSAAEPVAAEPAAAEPSPASAPAEQVAAPVAASSAPESEAAAPDSAPAAVAPVAAPAPVTSSGSTDSGQPPGFVRRVK